MLLAKVQVENFRSIDKSGEVAIDPKLTVLVGQNESGKTAFLSALDLSYPVRPGPGFDLDRDFPRKAVTEYRKTPAAEPAVATRLTYRLTPAELAAVNATLGLDYLPALEFTITHTHKNTRTITLGIKNVEYVKHLLAKSNLPDEVVQGNRSRGQTLEIRGVFRARDRIAVSF
jgi:hypothetical protein